MQATAHDTEYLFIFVSGEDTITRYVLPWARLRALLALLDLGETVYVLKANGSVDVIHPELLTRFAPWYTRAEGEQFGPASCVEQVSSHPIPADLLD